jgi:hypothetical protein
MSEHDNLYSDKLIKKFEDTVVKYDIKHVVYVGLPPKDVFRAKRQMWWLRICSEHMLGITLIEIFEPWAKNLIEEGFNVVCEDICNYDPVNTDSMLLWSHGPEHISKDEFNECLPNLVKKYKNICVAMPYGIWEQGSKINPYEVHKWHADVDDLISLGFDYVDTNGPKDDFGDLFGVYYD